jgi:poly-gamma-glutamate synthesis protein (capsule biosynthesis protein)
MPALAGAAVKAVTAALTALTAAAMLCATAWAAPGRADAGGPEVTLVFAGDTTLDAEPGAIIRRGEDPFSAFAPLLRDADLRIVNLECVVATIGRPDPEKIYSFRAHPRVLPVLRRHFDGVTLANNHAGDYGRPAFAQMLDLLQRHGLARVGGGRNLADAHAPWIVERGGLRIALLAYNEYQPRSFEADHDAPGVAWSEDEQVVEDIRRARSAHRADLVIPFMHWGWENERTANARQRRLARLMIDAGADAVVGGHPHVTQDVEQYRGRPIVYSVGNFLMQQTDSDEQREGWVLRMRLDRDGVAGFDTHVARLDRRGVPRPDPDTPSPCWQRGETAVGQCRAGRPLR